MCEADKGRKATQALIRSHAVGQIFTPLSDITSGSGSLIMGLYIVSGIAVGVYTAVQLWTNSSPSPTKLLFRSLCILIEAVANVCFSNREIGIYLLTP